ncbi:MAG: bifunctional hydroxymethylpyrimidine kinase/phosphomethylpyrimidine kinase [Paraglaciecola sp.]|nr:bifunctional hydroxymethylpyrimidine kinase/phosphomethylpyrimidine kinase [Paraglaciecola sp.]
MATFDAKSQAVRPIVWSIAASDSGGGAGIQADSLTINDLGGHACNIVTAITAQNSLGVKDMVATSVAILAQQVNCLLEDMPPKAIKIGVLANAQQVRWLSQWLSETFANYQQQLQVSIPIIWDPVMLATTGQSLTDKDAPPLLADYLHLAKQVSLLTPNAQELRYLLNADVAVEHTEQWWLWLEILAHSIRSNVLLTGGGMQQGYAVDWMMVHDIAYSSEQHQHQIVGFKSAAINTPHQHGTGCTFSSAIATVLALDYPMLDAVCVAKAYVNQGLLAGYKVGQGAGVLARNGWPHTLSFFPTITLPHVALLHTHQPLDFAPVTTPLNIYPVTQSLGVLKQVLEAGARTVQLRVKSTTNQWELEQQIKEAVALGTQFQAQVFINDHWQLAVKYGAFGVHLGQEDLLQADLKCIANAGLALGLSSHGYFELLIAQQLHPSYLALGHIFATPTKTMPSQAQGLIKLKRYCQLLSGKLPLVAIGGINADNLAQVKRTGIGDVAIVRAIEQAPCPASSWQYLQQQWEMQA